jgi:hypothetical protein
MSLTPTIDLKKNQMSETFSSKTLLMTGVSDILPPKNNDVPMEEVFKLTLPSKQRYAEKHGYDLLTMRSFGSGKEYGFKDTNVGLLRMVRAFEMLKHYDVVMWIDADAIITNDKFTIKDSFNLNQDHCFYASYEWAEWCVPHQTFSTGNFILQRTKDTETLFSTFLEVGKNHIEGFGEEQNAMNWIYKNTTLVGTMKILEHLYLNAVPYAMYMDRIRCYNDIHQKIYSPWKDTDFLAHIGGLPNKNRINILNTHFKNYL